MPSPVGHALGGIAAGVPITGRSRAALWGLAAIGAAADLDLLAGVHRGISHSVGAAIVVGAVAWLISRSPQWGLASAAAWGSHVLLDWLGADTWPPIGIPVFWPYSDAYYRSPVSVFPSVSRQYWLGARFLSFNLKALAVEVLILLPLVWLVTRVTPPVRHSR